MCTYVWVRACVRVCVCVWERLERGAQAALSLKSNTHTHTHTDAETVTCCNKNDNKTSNANDVDVDVAARRNNNFKAYRSAVRQGKRERERGRACCLLISAASQHCCCWQIYSSPQCIALVWPPFSVARGSNMESKFELELELRLLGGRRFN